MENNLRPCTFQIRERQHGLTDTFPGKFHKWGSKIYEDDKGFHETTIAIVEDTSGVVHEIEPAHVIFTDIK